jgi:hypothetical protein
MKTDDVDWLDWLHKTREESEKERIAKGISGADWLRQVERDAESVWDRVKAHRQLVVRDKKA